MSSSLRVGHGFDVHRFRRGRKLLLGGIAIPYSLGLIGHSDADVVLHALINAILGAMGKGDIGVHFPEDDSRYKDISSAELLHRISKLMRQSGYVLINACVTIVAQKPKLAPHYSPIRKNLARLLHLGESEVNVGATTTEKLGWIGEGKGIAATAVVLLRKKSGARSPRLTNKNFYNNQKNES